MTKDFLVKYTESGKDGWEVHVNHEKWKETYFTLHESEDELLTFLINRYPSCNIEKIKE